MMTDSFWERVFGNRHPVEVEVGAGTGTFLLPAAGANRHVNYFAIEAARGRAAALQAAIVERDLANAHVIAADAACVITHLVPPASVAAYHVYFPDPWWKRRHHRRRLITPAFIAALARSLAPGGHLHVATDVPFLFDLILKAVATCPSLQRSETVRSPRTTTTVFERKGRARGAAILEASFVRDAIAADRVGPAGLDGAPGAG